MKIVLFVEGYTEKKALPEFLKLWLDSKLSTRIGREEAHEHRRSSH